MFQQSLDVLVTTDTAALGIAQWVLYKHQSTAPRLSSVTFDLLTSTSAASILALEIGDRLSLSSMPSQMFTGAGDYTIEGWSESRDVDTWTISFNVLPWTLSQAAIWDDSNSKWDSAVWGP